MPATNPPRHGLGQPPITHLLRASRPLRVTHCPSSNHLIGDRVNTETSYHHQRVGLSSPLVTPQPLTQSLLPGPPLGAAFHWLGPNTPQRLMWAGPQLMTSLGASNHVLCWSGPRAGTPGEPHHCQHHLWWGKGLCISPRIGQTAFSPSSPSHTLGSPQGF